MDTGNQAAPTLDERRLVAEIENLEASRRKANAEADKAEHEVEEGKKSRSFLERILSTTQFTVGLALVTFMFQIAQFWINGQADRDSRESSQWKDAVMHISFKGDESSVGSALDVETFLNSKTYGSEARKLTADILPYIKDSNALGTTLDRLLVPNKDTEAYTVATTVSARYRGVPTKIHLASLTQHFNISELCSDDLSDLLQRDPYDLNETDSNVVEADYRDDQIDAVTREFEKYWRKRGIPSALGSEPVNLSGIILRKGPEDGTDSQDTAVNLGGLDLSRANLKGSYLCKVNFSKSNLQNAALDQAVMDFANLTQADLRGASFCGTHLQSVTKFDGSRWDGVRWWEAATLSPELSMWLYSPQGKAAGAGTPPNEVPTCSAN